MCDHASGCIHVHLELAINNRVRNYPIILTMLITELFELKSQIREFRGLEEETLDEMPLPTNWDPAAMGKGTSFKSRLAYALEQIGRAHV